MEHDIKILEAEIHKCQQCPFSEFVDRGCRYGTYIACRHPEAPKKPIYLILKLGEKFPLGCPLSDAPKTKVDRTIEALAEEAWSLWKHHLNVKEEIFKQAIRELIKSGDFIAYCTWSTDHIEDKEYTIAYQPYAGVEQLKRQILALNTRMKEMEEAEPVYYKVKSMFTLDPL